MANKIPEEELKAIESIVHRYPEGVSASDILGALNVKVPKRTLQYRLKHLVYQNRIVMDGQVRWATYRSADSNSRSTNKVASEDAEYLLVKLSDDAITVRNYVSQPIEARSYTGYNRSFLDQYRPNKTFYLTQAERTHLAKLGQQPIVQQPAGTYARTILGRLLIDLAWNSSRLEGNTYSLLDTRRLLQFGEEAGGRPPLETQMILNHKDAIEFLVDAADEIGFNNYTIINLHALLANNLLSDLTAIGRLRRIEVGIGHSTFMPLNVPQLIEECFIQVLATANAIQDPFEQALFVMVQLPYLQPFDDVNKRVSRLAANIPLIRNNLSPLSFADVSRQAYTEAILGVYELNNTALLKDIFIWAYERSAARYTAVRQSLGEPDPFRLTYRTQLREVIQHVVHAKASRRETVNLIATWAEENISLEVRSQFVEVVESEIIGLHEGNFARYQIRLSEFKAWWRVWSE